MCYYSHYVLKTVSWSKIKITLQTRVYMKTNWLTRLLIQPYPKAPGLSVVGISLGCASMIGEGGGGGG